ncbi:hypothetical protein L596_009243 [Steinernema carpocapsae]|uniref:Uncharacterized protein n=1 Tax=Steinernema carpocapsae TaxID=34508 RepID=A0A4U5PF27_STECR|nr:hypothetical protein L596_009243 [Steinernema carpocapsae]
MNSFYGVLLISCALLSIDARCVSKSGMDSQDCTEGLAMDQNSFGRLESRNGQPGILSQMSNGYQPQGLNGLTQGNSNPLGGFNGQPSFQQPQGTLGSFGGNNGNFQPRI